MKCVVCGKEHNKLYTGIAINHNTLEFAICKNCIMKHKKYKIVTEYDERHDKTYIYVEVHVPLEFIARGDYLLLSTTLIGYQYGEPADDYIEYAYDKWLSNNRKELLRENYNDGYKLNEEVLY